MRRPGCYFYYKSNLIGSVSSRLTRLLGTKATSNAAERNVVFLAITVTLKLVVAAIPPQTNVEGKDNQQKHDEKHA
jgi:hypothetical protein